MSNYVGEGLFRFIHCNLFDNIITYTALKYYNNITYNINSSGMMSGISRDGSFCVRYPNNSQLTEKWGKYKFK